MKKILLYIILVLSFTNTFARDYAKETLVDISVVDKLISQDNTVVLDIRSKDDYEKGHLEGAINVTLGQFIAKEGEYDFPFMSASNEEIAGLLGAMGISNDTRIVLVDYTNNLNSSRLWWELKLLGHENINLINGDINTINLPLTTEVVVPQEVEYTPSINIDYLATIEDVKNATLNSDVVILDSRSLGEHDGFITASGALAPGRIPTSKFLEWNDFLNQDGTFKSRKEIEDILARNGIRNQTDIITYCQVGVRSAHTVFVLSELLGWDNIKNYDGSWVEWTYEASIDESIVVEKDNIFKTIFSFLKERSKMEKLISSLGIFGPLAYIVIYALVTITCISPLPVVLVGGIVFGGVMGIVYTAIAASLGLSLSFLIARYIARKPLEKKFGDKEIFQKIDRGVKEEGWFILATTRLLPIFPFGAQNYVYGLTSISFVQYAVLSTLFILPGTSAFVLLAGAVASGDMAVAAKYGGTASLILFGLTLITKVISKKVKVEARTA